MIDWLCEAFGFERHKVVKDEQGGIRLAQLKHGAGLIIISSVQTSAMNDFMAQPSDIGGLETQVCYIKVSNLESHRATAEAAGAEILMQVNFDSDTRSAAARGYVCKDREGHIWIFGTYDPWLSMPPAAESEKKRARSSAASGVLSLVLAIGLAMSLAFTAWLLVRSPEVVSLSRLLPFGSGEQTQGQSGGGFGSSQPPSDAGTPIDTADGPVKALRAELEAERASRLRAERALADMQAALQTERLARERAEQRSYEIEQQLRSWTSASDRWEEIVRELRKQLADQQSSVLAAERRAGEAVQRLERERDARQSAEIRARQATEALLPERNARMAAELAANELRNELLSLRKSDSPAEYEHLRELLAAERDARAAAEKALVTVREELAHEKRLREAAERLLKTAQTPGSPSCWVNPETCSEPRNLIAPQQ